MSRKLIQRTFVENSYYHIFNRGNNKNAIFLDKSDYTYFFQLFDCYLQETSPYRPSWITKHFTGDIELAAYCLMSNHFHVLVYQHNARSIAAFLSALLNRYTKYFNKKYGTVGHLFQGTYKARLIESDGDLLSVSRYIHRNPLDITTSCVQYPYSSAQFYTGDLSGPLWLRSDHVLSCLHHAFGVAPDNLKATYQKYLLL